DYGLFTHPLPLSQGNPCCLSSRDFEKAKSNCRRFTRSNSTLDSYHATIAAQVGPQFFDNSAGRFRSTVHNAGKGDFRNTRHTRQFPLSSTRLGQVPFDKRG